jgi:hypothetical protein
MSSVFLRLRDILVECYCVSLWQTRYIGSIDCRPHDGGSMSDGTFIVVLVSTEPIHDIPLRGGAIARVLLSPPIEATL